MTDFPRLRATTEIVRRLYDRNRQVIVMIQFRRVVILALSLAAAAAISACNRHEPGGDGRPRIALVLKTLNSPYFIEMQRGAEEAARRLNVDLVVQAAEREVDVERQMQIVENMVQARVGALALTPSGSREVVSAITKVNAAGIPVIIVDTRLDSRAAADAGVKTASFIG